MDIVLDSNVYLSDYKLESDKFIALFDHLRKANGRLVLFALVRDEVLESYARIFSKQVLERWSKITPHIVDRKVLPSPDLNIQKNALRKQLLSPNDGNCIVIEGYDGVDVAEIARRGIYRIPPANTNGEELRDVILWLQVVDHAKKHKTQVVFISNDSGFWKEGVDEPKDEIKSDITSTQGLLRIYKSVEHFLAENVLTTEPVSREWALNVFERGDLGRVLLARTLAKHFPEVYPLSHEIKSVDFVKGSLYNISVDSRFAEISYRATVDVEARVTTYTLAPMNSPTFINAIDSGAASFVEASTIWNVVEENSVWNSYQIPTYANSVLSQAAGTNLVNPPVPNRLSRPYQPTTRHERIKLTIEAKFSLWIQGETLIQSQVDALNIENTDVRPLIQNE